MIDNLQAQPPTLDDILKWENASDNPYNISKHLLNYASEILAESGADIGVEVCAVDPGWVQTDMGGAGAPRSLEEGGKTISKLAAETHNVSGKVFSSALREVKWKGF